MDIISKMWHKGKYVYIQNIPIEELENSLITINEQLRSEVCIESNLRIKKEKTEAIKIRQRLLDQVL